MTKPTDIQPAELPTTITAYLKAHAARDTEAALSAFSPDAVVTDEGRTFHGTEEVADFLRKAGAEYTYTTTLVGAQRVDATRWVAVNHLEGNFPGGVVDLKYHFTLSDNLITNLDITP
ncbi:hypothetical protein GCM10009557_13730 [Virgisporangium ochraceum]|uniref:SnoaL-like domain-containing protein n=1 Tax=Virgisporangium ochraceum TaxID=65505 RepID=A0A8J4EGL1_9ACTN|nr:nuclear transport factor 2 family protein [Virgisporangium ochraceum]GIJ71247.1 hypothetical protein Voc01_061640 [Virgisporangium ochraceum]